MKLAFVFPGQGSQYVGMGQAIAQAYPAGRAALDEADAALGGGLLRLMYEGPEEELRKTANTQPAILAVSSAVHRAVDGRCRPSVAREDLCHARQLGAALVAGAAMAHEHQRLRTRGSHRLPHDAGNHCSAPLDREVALVHGRAALAVVSPT